VIAVFSSAGWAYQISWSNAICLCVHVDIYVCVWMLSRVEQIITAAHRDLYSCMHRPTNELFIIHQKLGQSYLFYRSKSPTETKLTRIGIFKPAKPHSPWDACYCVFWTYGVKYMINYFYYNATYVCYSVKNLLNAGACPDCSNEDGLTVLHQVSNLFSINI